jgi:hypothetical protein
VDLDLDGEDDLEEFRLPMSHRATENLDTKGLKASNGPSSSKVITHPSSHLSLPVLLLLG